jgi:OPA family glycerol-3-phosphate transporter-like MFS transporter
LTSEAALTTEQRRIVLTAWGTYASYYLGRLNLSIALPALTTALAVSRAEVGILGTVFFWTYGIGTLVNGELGNILRPRLLVAAGLLLIIVVNLAFSLQTSLLAMAILWAINGVAQSTGWSPLLRVITDHLSAPQRAQVSTLFPISFQIGAAATWVLTGALVATWGWQAAFSVPGLLLCLTLAHWWRSRIDGRETQAARFDLGTSLGDLRGFAPLLLANALGGFALVGTILWTPTYVVDTGFVPASATGIVSAALPLFGIAGMFGSGVLMRRGGRAEVAAIQLLAVGVALMIIALPLPLLAQALVLLLALTVLGGLGGIMTSAIPVQFARAGRTSSTVGIFNSAFNLGGGFAGFASGALLESSGWNAVLLLWAAALALALLMIVSFRQET